ncbi:hypothetical protein ES707_09779 [subsurface metagenome]
MQEHQRPVCRYINTLESRRLQNWAYLALSRTDNREPCNGDSCSSSGRLRRWAPRILLAGCAIGEYSATITRCHDTQLSKEAKEELAAGRGKVAIAVVGRLTEAEDEQRREAQKRALRTTPAKHTIPGKEAESAIIQQNSDKAAEAEYLTRVFIAAKRNSRSLRKRANQAQKLRFSDGPCS